MDGKIKEFVELAHIFENNGFHLYLVGGTVRDYLLKLPLNDMDAVSDATPDEIVSFLSPIDGTFKRFGSLKYKTANGLKFDITTLRQESGYIDARHPQNVTFVRDLKLDYPRRDFTVNALYMDKDLKVYDYVNGRQDLSNRLLKMVGDPEQRIKEDPLRILRAIRFHLVYRLAIDDSLFKAMKNNFSLLKNVTDAKIKSELAKLNEYAVDENEKNKIFSQFGIANLVGVIK